MSYEIQWYPKARKNFERLPRELQERVSKKLDEVSEEPFRYLGHFAHEDFYKLRIGDYRVLIDVDFENKILHLRVFDHRGSIY